MPKTLQECTLLDREVGKELRDFLHYHIERTDERSALAARCGTIEEFCQKRQQK